MSWDNIDFDTLVSGCITTGYQDGSPRVSLVDTLNYLIDALNEKIYATQYNVFPAFITKKFEKGAILFNSDFITDFNNLVYKYWLLWKLNDWYSSGALTDVVNYNDYLLTDADLIAATSQEFYDLLSAGTGASTFRQRWSGEFFQNIKTLYGLMRYCQIEDESEKNSKNKSAAYYYSNDNDSLYATGRATPAPHGISSECVPWVETSLPLNLQIPELETQAHTNTVNALVPVGGGTLFYELNWGLSSSVSDFYNRRTDRVIYNDYFDNNKIYISMKKYSTGAFVGDIDFALVGYVLINEIRRSETLADVDGGNTVFTYSKKDNNFPDQNGEFDLVEKLGTGGALDAAKGYGYNFTYESANVPLLRLQNPPTNLCQNTSGSLRGIGENHRLELRSRYGFMIIDSNNKNFDYYIAP